MILKRHYDRPDGWEAQRDARGNVLNPPPLKFIEVKDTGTHVEQNWSVKVIQLGIEQGWMTLSQGKLLVHGKVLGETGRLRNEDLEYQIVRMPGYYCCHCGEPIVDAGLYTPDEEGVTFGARHVRDAHKDAESPDPSNPSGYRRINHYETVLNKEQHAQYRKGRANG